MHDSTLIALEDVCFGYGKILTFNKLTLRIAKGDFVLINGPSGSGKSTLLRIIARLDEIKTGQISYNGIPYSDYLPPILRQKVTLIQQTPVILSGTVYDNLLLPFSYAINQKLLKPTKEELIQYLSDLQLFDIIDQEAQTLSVGQKQRVSILRTLLLHPDVILMDEPTSALDPESKYIVEQITEKLNEDGKTILMISHSDYKPSNIKYRNIYVNNGIIEVLK